MRKVMLLVLSGVLFFSVTVIFATSQVASPATVCVFDANNNGEAEQGEVANCETTQQGDICPLRATPCSLKCPDGFEYSDIRKACVADPVCPQGYRFFYIPVGMCSGCLADPVGGQCPQGGTLRCCSFSFTGCETRKCVVDPTCPAGSTYRDGKCEAPQQMVCPYGSQYPCMQYQNQWMCSDVPCGTFESNPDETPEGSNDQQNNGWSGSECLGTLYVFSGRDLRCRPPGTQTLFSNCCSKDRAIFGIDLCTSTEKELATLRTTYLNEDYTQADANCHYVGEYCTERWKLLGISVCVQKKKTFCCFSSPLARIIHEQGRPQLGISWGSPESPNCRGFSILEFQKLDFSKMDFSEWVNQIVGSRVGPNVESSVNNAIQNLQQNLQNMLQQ